MSSVIPSTKCLKDGHGDALPAWIEPPGCIYGPRDPSPWAGSSRVEPGKSAGSLGGELLCEEPEGGKWTVMGKAYRAVMKSLTSKANQPD